MPGVWYPSCKVRLLVRFEEFLPTPATPSPAIPGEPEAFGGQLFDTLKFDVIPYNCSVTLNSYREADIASVTIPFGALPFDPRILRACAIQIFMGSINPQDYADGMGPIAGQSKLTVVPDSADPTSSSAANEVFRGFVDTIELNQDGSDTITLDCRDQTAIFLDAEVQQQAAAGLPRNMPLDEVIRQIIIGEAVSQTLPQAPPLKWTVAQRQTARGKRRRATATLAAIGAKITTTAAALGQATDPASIAEITQEMTRLAGRQAQAAANQAAAAANEVKHEAIPLLAQRIGVPGARGTQVINETRFTVMPTLAELRGVKWFDSKGVSKKAAAAASRRKINYWDLITDMCVASGFICYMRRPTTSLPGGVIPPAELVITEPRTYYGDQVDVASGITILADEIREFAYGYNVESIAIERNLTGKNAPQAIQVNARVSETGDLMSVRFPPTDKDPTGTVPFPANRAAPSSIGDKIEIQTINYRGEIPEARAQEILSLLAEKIYEELSRGEFTVTIKTKDLSFFESTRDESVPDIFQLRAGDSIRVGTITNATPDIEKGLVTHAGIFAALPLQTRIERYLALGLSPTAAVGAAQAYESPLFPNVFRVKTVGLKFDHNTGFDITVEAINYLDARNALANVEGL